MRRILLISDLLSESFRTTALSAAMRGAGKAVRFLPIPQPTILVGPGSSRRLGQTIAGFGHGKILIVNDSIISKLGLLDDLTGALTAGGGGVRDIRCHHARRTDSTG